MNIPSFRAIPAYTLYYCAVGNQSSPFISVYPWSDYGYGTKYANPSTLPTGTCRNIHYTKDGKCIALAHDNSPFVSVYQWSHLGFGTRYSNPANPPLSHAWGIKFSPNSNYVAIASESFPASNSGPYLQVYAWSNSSGFGTRYSIGTPTIPHVGRSVDFSPDGNTIAMAHDFLPGTSPGNSQYRTISVWAWNNPGFGTKYSGPSPMPTDNGWYITFSKDGSAIALSHLLGLFSIFPFSTSTGLGTKYTYSGFTVTATNSQGIDFSPSNTAVAVNLGSADSTKPQQIAIQWSSSGYGSKYTDPAVSRPGNTRGIAFSPNERAIVKCIGTGTYSQGIVAWGWNTLTGWGSLLAFPSTPPTSTSQSVAFGVIR